MPSSSHNIDSVRVTFDHDQAVADAGLMLTGTLVKRLGLEEFADEVVGVGYRPGRKLLTLVQTIVAGGDCIDDVNLLRAGATSRIVGHDTVAASTVGSWLRQFTFGHVRQLDRVAEAALTRAWAAGGGPGDGPMFIDVDSTVVEVHGHDKQGAAYGYTRVLGYHPILATRADTGEVLHSRMRKGSANTGRGAQRFVRETIGRVRRAGAAGKLTLRADSGFWSHKVMDACVAHGVDFSITVRARKHVVAAIEAINEQAWVDIDYTDRGQAQVAETVLGGYRLVVRRTKVTDDPKVLALFPDWRHHAFVTNRQGDAVALDADHRAHAVQELAIRDLKQGAALNHCPSGIFNANAAWLIAATLAHNLARWVDLLGAQADRPSFTTTLRRRLLNIAGRLTRTARTWTLHLPTRWPWRHLFDDALKRLRALPAIA
jgi:hypothetical protein